MKYFIFLLLIFITATGYTQSVSGLVKESNGDTIVFASSNLLYINGLLSIRMKPNHFVLQYDSVSNIYCVNAGVMRGDCARVDEELWLFYDDNSYYYSFTDWCNKLCFWKGDENLQNNFRPTNDNSKRR